MATYPCQGLQDDIGSGLPLSLGTSTNTSQTLVEHFESHACLRQFRSCYLLHPSASAHVQEVTGSVIVHTENRQSLDKINVLEMVKN